MLVVIFYKKLKNRQQAGCLPVIIDADLKLRESWLMKLFRSFFCVPTFVNAAFRACKMGQLCFSAFRADPHVGRACFLMGPPFVTS
jgi:hypothetical protein